MHRALVYKEWKQVAWIAMMMILIQISDIVYPIISELSCMKTMQAESGYYIPKYWFNMSLLPPSEFLVFGIFLPVLLMVIVLFRTERQTNTAGLLASMPLTRKQIITTKWVAGAVPIILSYTITFLSLSIFYLINKTWIGTSYMDIPQWYLLNMLFTMTVFAFLFFVQTVMGQNIIAGVVGFISMWVPWFLISAFSEYLRVFFNLGYNTSLLQKIDRISDYLVWTNLVDPRIEFLHNEPFEHFYFYTKYGLRAAIPAILSTILFLLAYRAYTENPMEKSGEVLIFDFLKPVLTWGFAICLGLLLGIVFGMGYGNNEPVMVAMFLIPGLGIGYLISSRTIRFFEH